jgi:hypothetical protein
MAFSIKKDVFRLQVPMNDTILVKVCNCTHNLCSIHACQVFTATIKEML